MKAASRSVALGAGLVAAVLALASLAWACSPTAVYTDVGTATPGTELSVWSHNFQAEGGPVEIWWDRGQPTAQLLGAAELEPGTRSFSTAVTVPDADPGKHYVWAVQKDADGKTIAYGSKAITVPAMETSGGESTETEPVTTQKTSGASKAESAPKDSRSESRPKPQKLEIVETSGPAVVTSSEGEQVFGGSLPAPVAQVDRKAGAGDTVPSQRSAYGETTSGLSGFEANFAAPSLLDPVSESDGSGAALGAVLLGAGLAVAAGGLLVAEVARRRRTAEVRSR